MNLLTKISQNLYSIQFYCEKASVRTWIPTKGKKKSTKTFLAAFFRDRFKVNHSMIVDTKARFWNQWFIFWTEKLYEATSTLYYSLETLLAFRNFFLGTKSVNGKVKLTSKKPCCITWSLFKFDSIWDKKL